MDVLGVSSLTLALAPIALRAATGLVEGLGDFRNLLTGADQGQSQPPLEATASEQPPWLVQDLGARTAQLTSWRQDVEGALERFGQRLVQRMSEAGLSSDEPFELQLNGGSEVRVVGRHAQPAALERLIAEDAELAEAFRDLTAKLRLLQRLESSSGQAGDALSVPEPIVRIDRGRTTWR